MAMILSTNSGIEPPNINFLTLPTGGATLPTKLLVIQSSGNVGIGTTTPAFPLDVAGDINSSGTITAAGFSGAGGGLTNLTPGNLSAGTAAISITGNAATATNATQLGGLGPSAFAQLAAASNTFTGGVSAASFSGNGAGLTNLTPGNISAGTAGINISGNAATATTATSAANAATASNALSLGGVAAGNYARRDIANNFAGTQTVTSGDVSVSAGNFDLPQTTSASTGVINLGGGPFVHACCGSSAFNTFIGPGAGNFTNNGALNTATGHEALTNIATGSGNTASGFLALYNNTSGSENTALGYSAIYENDQGWFNVGVGWCALDNTKRAGTGSLNCNRGTLVQGDGNTALGADAGQTNTTGQANTFLGYMADASSGTQTNATAIGANAFVSANNALVLGSINGVNGATSSVSVGIGTPTPGAALEVDSSEGFWAPQAYLVQTNASDFSRLRFDVYGANYWDIAVSGGSAQVMNFYRADVGNVMSLTPGGSQYMLMGNTAYLSTGGVWTNASDRNQKAHFHPVSGRDVLRRLSAIPITTWNYKAEGSGVRHMGPMAQDFRAAFGLGDDDKHITTIDEGGVALAAIQELYRQDLEKSAQIEAQKEEITKLRAEVEKLQQVQDRLAALETRLARMEGPK
jgi:hypothetical protein